MNILFLTRRFWPSIGGVETHVGEISQVLQAKGHQIVLVKEKSSKTYSKSYHSNSLNDKFAGKHKIQKIYEIPSLKDNWFKKFSIWKWILEHKSIIEKADIVHCHDVFFWYLPFRFLYPRKPVFTTFHGYETRFPPAKKALIVRKIFEKLSYGNICVGDFIKKWYGTKPDYVIYGGVNIQTKIANRKVQNYNSKLKILFIGRLEEDTGVPVYLEALSLLKKKGIHFEFEVCGDGSLRKNVEKYGRVHGFVFNNSYYLQKADIVFASSYLSILEAMCFKKMVISAYSNPLKKDYLHMSLMAQFISIFSNPEDLVLDILRYVKNQKTKEKMINQGYAWAREQTWEKVVNTYISLWNKK